MTLPEPQEEHVQYIEVKDTDGDKVLVNIDHIVAVHKTEDGALIVVRGSEPIEVSESYIAVRNRIDKATA